MRLGSSGEARRLTVDPTLTHGLIEIIKPLTEGEFSTVNVDINLLKLLAEKMESIECSKMRLSVAKGEIILFRWPESDKFAFALAPMLP